jgi:signal transduction histidine kinase/DNA-binding response OmpR family regulator
MSTLLFWLQQAVLLAFVLLGVLVAADWLRTRDRHRGFLVLAIVLLATVAGLSRLQSLAGGGKAMSALVVAAFVGSGYSVFRFRAAFLPVSRGWHRAVLATALLSAGLLVALVLADGQRRTVSPLAWAALAAVAAWGAMVAEPIVRFWVASRKRPAVQRARLQALSGGFAGLLLVVVVSAVAGSAGRSPAVQLALQLVALGIVPLLYISFAPPAWLRRQWRAGEESAQRKATQDLLTATSAAGIAELALDRALRLVGAEAGCVADERGTVLATRGLDGAAAGELVAFGRSSSRALVIPLDFSAGSGSLALMSGPFTPLFGADERLGVEQYAAAVAPALERIALVDELRQANAELEEASRHKSKFLANMSHELRTPLNAILGFSELLIDDDASLAPAVRRTFLDNIHNSGRHLLGLINDILDLAKVEAGQAELYLEAVTLDDVVRNVLDLVRPLAGQKRIELSQAGDAGTVQADLGKVKQMLINLVSNAIKFTPADGRVEVSCRRQGKEVVLVVRDSGMGIPEEELPRIFEEFKQLEPAPGQTSEGTGLGLALTKRFAELHGGWVEVRSHVGRGSTFTIHLPVEARPAPPAAPVPAEPPASGNGPLVLVVEDNPQAVDLLRTYLARGGYRVEVATTGKSALEMARRLRPHAITLDLQLPEIDGWDVLAALKHDPDTGNIPVVVVSIVDAPARGRALGAVDYLVKPVDGKALLACLEPLQLAGRREGEEVRILVVDDDPLHHERMEGLLRSEGFTVIKAFGGIEGIQRAHDCHPALVILDLLMPDLSGFNVVTALKSDTETARIPILVMTAKELSRQDKRWLNGQAAAVLHKPSVAGVDLLAWLDQILNSRSPAITATAAR